MMRLPAAEVGTVGHTATHEYECIAPEDDFATSTGSVEDAMANIKAHGVKYTSRFLERTGVTQVFFRDPDGVGVELNFAPK